MALSLHRLMSIWPAYCILRLNVAPPGVNELDSPGLDTGVDRYLLLMMWIPKNTILIAENLMKCETF